MSAPQLIMKEGTDAKGIRPELLVGLMAAAFTYASVAGVPCVVTALLNGTHMSGSLHYKGLAADFRVPSRFGCPPDTDEKVRTVLAENLGVQWVVLLEGEIGDSNRHIHIQFLHGKDWLQA